MQNDHKLKDTISKKVSKSQLSHSSFSASFLTEGNEPHETSGGVWDDMSIPDERDWRRDVQHLRQKIGEFNINNYVKKVLTEEEQARYNKICQKIPAQSRVYMQ